MAPQTRNVAIQIEGLKALQSSLKRMQPESRREVPEKLREGVILYTLPRARSLTPVRSADMVKRDPASGEIIPPGRLRSSERVYAVGNNVTLVSRLGYANVIHWGGSTGRGHTRTHPGATKITGRFFFTRAILETAGALLEEIDRGLIEVFRRNGWR